MAYGRYKSKVSHCRRCRGVRLAGRGWASIVAKGLKYGKKVVDVGQQVYNVGKKAADLYEAVKKPVEKGYQAYKAFKASKQPPPPPPPAELPAKVVTKLPPDEHPRAVGSGYGRRWY